MCNYYICVRIILAKIDLVTYIVNLLVIKILDTLHNSLENKSLNHENSKLLEAIHKIVPYRPRNPFTKFHLPHIRTYIGYCKLVAIHVVS